MSGCPKNEKKKIGLEKSLKKKVWKKVLLKSKKKKTQKGFSKVF